MSPTNHTKNSCNYRALLFLAIYSTATALLSLPSVSDAGEWVLVPNSTVELIFTDNVRLAPKNDPAKEADFVTRLVPGIYSKYTSRRFDSEIDYRLVNVLYQNASEQNRTLHNLNAANTGEIIEDLLYVDGNVRMQQQNATLLGRQGDDVNITGNLRNIRQYTASPYLRRRFGDIATTEVRYARILTDSDSSSTFFNSQTNSYTGSILSGPEFQVLQWGLNYARQDIDFDLRPDTVRLESGIASIRYNFNRRFALTGTGGYENNTFGGGGFMTKPTGARWSAGFIWAPTPRTNIEASAGQRFFGDNYFINASHRTRLFAMNTYYKEDINSAWNILNIEPTGNTTAALIALFTAQAPPGTDPADILQLVQLLIAELGIPASLAYAQGFLTNRFYLQKNFESSIAMNTAKNTVLIRAFHTTRKPLDNRPILDAGLGNGLLANVKQKGVSILWSLAISPRTRFSANFLYNHLYFPALFRTDHVRLYTAAVSRDLTENIFGLISYRRNERDSDAPFASYTENRFTASLNARF